MKDEENAVRKCGHPNLIPTRWNQPKPEPVEMVGCKCGQNASCPVCGFGWGAIPCACRPAPASSIAANIKHAGFPGWVAGGNSTTVTFTERSA